MVVTEAIEISAAPTGAFLLEEQLADLQLQFGELDVIKSVYSWVEQTETDHETKKKIGAAVIEARHALHEPRAEFITAADAFSGEIAAQAQEKLDGAELEIGGHVFDYSQGILIQKDPGKWPVIFGEVSHLFEYTRIFRRGVSPKLQKRKVEVRLATLDEWEALLANFS